MQKITNINNIKYKTHQYSCVYFLHNTINNKLYVGSTKNFYNRMRQYKSAFKRKRKISVIDRAISKHNIVNFCIYHIPYEQEIILQKEKFWIDLLKPEYNCQLDPVKKTNSEITRKEISISVKEYINKRKEKIIPNSSAMKKFNVFDAYGKKLYSFRSISEMADFMNWNKNSCWSKFCRKYKCYYYDNFIVIPDKHDMQDYILNCINQPKLIYAPIVNIVDNQITHVYIQSMKKKVKYAKNYLYTPKYNKRNPHIIGSYTYLGLNLEMLN